MTLLMFAGSFWPSPAAIVVVASTRWLKGLRAWLSRCLQWRIGWGWWTLALLLPLSAMLLAAGLHIALGGDITSAPASGHLLMTAVNLPLVLLALAALLSAGLARGGRASGTSSDCNGAIDLMPESRHS